MTRIVCIQEIELKPGVTGAEFEQAMRAFLAHESTPGCRDSSKATDTHDRENMDC